MFTSKKPGPCPNAKWPKGLGCTIEGCGNVHKPCNKGKECPNKTCFFIHPEDWAFAVGKGNKAAKVNGDENTELKVDKKPGDGIDPAIAVVTEVDKKGGDKESNVSNSNSPTFGASKSGNHPEKVATDSKINKNKPHEAEEAATECLFITFCVRIDGDEGAYLQPLDQNHQRLVLLECNQLFFRETKAERTSEKDFLPPCTSIERWELTAGLGYESLTGFELNFRFLRDLDKFELILSRLIHQKIPLRLQNLKDLVLIRYERRIKNDVKKESSILLRREYSIAYLFSFSKKEVSYECTKDIKASKIARAFKEACNAAITKLFDTSAGGGGGSVTEPLECLYSTQFKTMEKEWGRRFYDIDIDAVDQFGDVYSAMLTDPRSDVGFGYFFVNFDSQADCDKAFIASQKTLMNDGSFAIKIDDSCSYSLFPISIKEETAKARNKEFVFEHMSAESQDDICRGIHSQKYFVAQYSVKTAYNASPDTGNFLANVYGAMAPVIIKKSEFDNDFSCALSNDYVVVELTDPYIWSSAIEKAKPIKTDHNLDAQIWTHFPSAISNECRANLSNYDKRKDIHPVDHLSHQRGYHPEGRIVAILKLRERNRYFAGFVKTDEDSEKSYLVPTPISKHQKYPPLFIPQDALAKLKRDAIPPPFGIKRPSGFLYEVKTKEPVEFEWLNDFNCFSRKIDPTSFKEIGLIGDLDAEGEAIVINAGIPSEEFPDIVWAEVKEISRKFKQSLCDKAKCIVDKSRLSDREDLRKPPYFIFSIDSTTTKDVDDALHVRSLGDGRVEVGVHIADVSHFMKPDSELDKEAARRVTSHYLSQINKKVNMVPDALSEGLFSLLPNEDRFALSCIWVMNEDGSFIPGEKPRFCKSVIRSCAKLSYKLVEKWINYRFTSSESETAENVKILSSCVVDLTDTVNKSMLTRSIFGAKVLSEAEKYDFLAILISSIKVMHRIASRRQIMLREVSISHETKIEKQLVRTPDGSIIIERKNKGEFKSRDLVSQFMTIANYFAGQYMLEFFGEKALLRSAKQNYAYNDTPLAVLIHKKLNKKPEVNNKLSLQRDYNTLIKLVKHAALTRTRFDADDLQPNLAALDEDNSSDEAQLSSEELDKLELTLDALSSMRGSIGAARAYNFPAVSTDFRQHYSSSLPYYTWYTSPIRRYSDVIVHRMLSAAIAFESDKAKVANTSTNGLAAESLLDCDKEQEPRASGGGPPFSSQKSGGGRTERGNVGSIASDLESEMAALSINDNNSNTGCQFGRYGSPAEFEMGDKFQLSDLEHLMASCSNFNDLNQKAKEASKMIDNLVLNKFADNIFIHQTPLDIETSINEDWENIGKLNVPLGTSAAEWKAQFVEKAMVEYHNRKGMLFSSGIVTEIKYTKNTKKPTYLCVLDSKFPTTHEVNLSYLHAYANVTLYVDEVTKSPRLIIEPRTVNIINMNNDPTYPTSTANANLTSKSKQLMVSPSRRLMYKMDISLLSHVDICISTNNDSYPRGVFVSLVGMAESKTGEQPSTFGVSLSRSKSINNQEEKSSAFDIGGKVFSSSFNTSNRRSVSCPAELDYPEDLEKHERVERTKPSFAVIPGKRVGQLTTASFDSTSHMVLSFPHLCQIVSSERLLSNPWSKYSDTINNMDSKFSLENLITSGGEDSPATPSTPNIGMSSRASLGFDTPLDLDAQFRSSTSHFRRKSDRAFPISRYFRKKLEIHLRTVRFGMVEKGDIYTVVHSLLSEESSTRYSPIVQQLAKLVVSANDLLFSIEGCSSIEEVILEYLNHTNIRIQEVESIKREEEKEANPMRSSSKLQSIDADDVTVSDHVEVLKAYDALAHFFLETALEKL